MQLTHASKKYEFFFFYSEKKKKMHTKQEYGVPQTTNTDILNTLIHSQPSIVRDVELERKSSIFDSLAVHTKKEKRPFFFFSLSHSQLQQQ
jgi:hypothetical protein